MRPGPKLILKVPHGQKAKPYVQKRKTCSMKSTESANLQRKQDYPRNCGSGGVCLVAETQQYSAQLSASTTDYNTMPKLLLRNAVKLADRAAMREKNLGIWQTYTWANVLEEVRAFSLGLRALGLKRDDTVRWR